MTTKANGKKDGNQIRQQRSRNHGQAGIQLPVRWLNIAQSGRIERINDAVQFIDSNDRDTWCRMGTAVNEELGDEGFGVWEAWAQQAKSFNANAARDVWKSIRPDGGVTIASLFYAAKEKHRYDDGRYQRPTPLELAERLRLTANRIRPQSGDLRGR